MLGLRNPNSITSVSVSTPIGVRFIARSYPLSLPKLPRLDVALKSVLVNVSIFTGIYAYFILIPSAFCLPLLNTLRNTHTHSHIPAEKREREGERDSEVYEPIAEQSRRAM